MIMEYLGKRNLYNRVKTLVNIELPICKKFDYGFSHCMEWLDYYDICIVSLSCGKCIEINQRVYDDDGCQQDIICNRFGDFHDGKYHFILNNNFI